MTQQGPSAAQVPIAAARPARTLRVLMAHWDGGGNIPPQRALARELKRRGHEVHVLTHDTLASAVAADGGAFHPVRDLDQWDPARPRSQDEEVDYIMRHVCGSPAFAAALLATYERLSPDVCLIDAMLLSTLAGAVERGLPCAAVNHLAWNPEAGVVAFLSSISASLPGRAAGSNFLGLLESAPLVLATTYREFGAAAVAPPHVRFVGPIREAVAPASWPRRFADRPLVLVSLSSVFQAQNATLRNICDALASLPVEVLVTTGRSVQPQMLPHSESIEARQFVPHDAVLPHVDLIVTHAGLGTLMYGAGAGAPCLCLPQGRDQNDNAARIVELGLGRALPPDAAPQTIREAVAAVLRDDALRARCRAFAAGVSRFGDLQGAGDLVVNLARAK
ncbi:MAG TPA: nucleotide disphospho-sugar-binding domain-containing protein [Caulobacteraceae bacterium]|nr:nucleotide disphospho-sugar-binding domain-containing protein [Caulobacteraceae bacterium]